MVHCHSVSKSYVQATRKKFNIYAGLLILCSLLTGCNEVKELLLPPTPLPGAAKLITLSPYGTKLAEAENYAVSIFLLQGDTKEIIWQANASNLVTELSFLDDSTIAFGDGTGTVEIWDVDQNNLIAYVTDCSPDSSITSIALIEEKNILACGSGSADRGVLMLWDLNKELFVGQFHEHRFSIDDISWSSPQQILATRSTFTDYISLWNFDNLRQPPIHLAEGSGTIHDLVFSPDGRYLPLGSMDNNFIIWDLQNDKAAYELEVTSDGVDQVAWSSNGRYIAASSGGWIIVWDMDTGEEIYRFDGSPYPDDLAFSQDNQRVVAVFEDGIIEEWDLDQK